MPWHHVNEFYSVKNLQYLYSTYLTILILVLLFSFSVFLHSVVCSAIWYQICVIRWVAYSNVWIQTPDSTVSPAPRATKGLRPTAWEWSQLKPTNRSVTCTSPCIPLTERLIYVQPPGRDPQQVLKILGHVCLDRHSFRICCFFLMTRCVNPTTPAKTTATVATSMLNASSLVTLVTQCTSANAVSVMLEMASSVERTLIWMDGPTRILCVEQMPPTIAKRYYITTLTSVMPLIWIHVSF